MGGETMSKKATIKRKEDKRVKLQRFANYLHRTREGMDFILFLGDDLGFGVVSSVTDPLVLAREFEIAANRLRDGQGIVEDDKTATKRAKVQARERFR